MGNGMSYEQVQEATPYSANVISDPPHIFQDLHSISCRVGPRASAVAYMYAGLKLGAEPDEVIAAAEKDNAPFTKFNEYKNWVRSSIKSLRRASSAS